MGTSTLWLSEIELASHADIQMAFETSYITFAATGLLAVVIAVTMGLFSKNQMPVEGKVCITPPPT